ALDSGAALAKAREWFEAQGADLSVFETEDWCTNPAVTEVRHEGRPGWVERIDAEAIGQAVLVMGGGRKQKTDDIDPSVGIVVHVEVGDEVADGQLLASVHGKTPAQPNSMFVCTEKRSDKRPIVFS
ncbi:MAG: hypothetical protein IH945_07395, partial [Armatimonadetes bacterium]|nr:hypothetical protein [Armatimonadota bacterium]